MSYDSIDIGNYVGDAYDIIQSFARRLNDSPLRFSFSFSFSLALLFFLHRSNNDEEEESICICICLVVCSFVLLVS